MYWHNYLIELYKRLILSHIHSSVLKLNVSMSQCYGLWSLISLYEQLPEANIMMRWWGCESTQDTLSSQVWVFFTGLSIEHWLQGTLWLYDPCDWQACRDFADKGQLKFWFSRAGIKPRTFSAVGKWLNHWTTQLLRAVYLLQCVNWSL